MPHGAASWLRHRGRPIDERVAVSVKQPDAVEPPNSLTLKRRAKKVGIEGRCDDAVEWRVFRGEPAAQRQEYAVDERGASRKADMKPCVPFLLGIEIVPIRQAHARQFRSGDDDFTIGAGERYEQVRERRRLFEQIRDGQIPSMLTPLSSPSPAASARRLRKTSRRPMTFSVARAPDSVARAISSRAAASVASWDRFAQITVGTTSAAAQAAQSRMAARARRDVRARRIEPAAGLAPAASAPLSSRTLRLGSKGLLPVTLYVWTSAPTGVREGVLSASFVNC